MERISLKIEVTENENLLKEILVSLDRNFEGESLCRPSVSIKDAKSGFEESIKLPSGDYNKLRKFMETIARGKLDGDFVVGIVRKISSLFQMR